MQITFAIACLTVACVSGGVKSDKQDDGSEIDELKQRLDEQGKIIARLMYKEENGESEINELKRQLKEQKKTLEKSFKREIEEQKAATETLFETLKLSMERRLEDQFNELKGYINNPSRNLQKIDAKDASNGAYQANGCIGDDVQLSCSDNRTIFVTHAKYGQYGLDYGQPSCDPHPYDCDESVSVTDEDQWIYIKYICDNQTVCSYPFEGSVFDAECAPGSLVDYISIYYDCLPEPTDEAVGFTANANSGTWSYDSNDLVRFDSTVSNIGGYYQKTSSQFLCPADGMYAFSLNIMTGTYGEFLGAIMKESAVLDSVFGDDMSGYLSSASNFVITACSKGERVWIRCLTDGDYMYNYGNSRYSTFSGFLLHRL